jgi:hypothetical protein
MNDRFRKLVFAAGLAVAGSACGGFENQPLGWAAIRGSLVGAGAGSKVSIFGHPELTDAPSTNELKALAADPTSTWAFELTKVPTDEETVDLMLLISPQRARRMSVHVVPGQVQSIPAQVGEQISMLVADLDAPSHQLVRKGQVKIDGTSIAISVEESEPEIPVPAGCYTITATVPGLGTITSPQACVGPGRVLREPMHFPEPDGSPGREGCSVTGCESGYKCERSEHEEEDLAKCERDD